MSDINKLFSEMLDLVMSLNDTDAFTKVFLTISHKRNTIAKEIEIKKGKLEMFKGELLSKEKVAETKVLPTLYASNPAAKQLADDIIELEEVRKLFQNTLDTVLLRRDLYIAERRVGI